MSTAFHTSLAFASNVAFIGWEQTCKGYNLACEDLFLRIPLTQLGGSGQAVSKNRNVKKPQIAKYIALEDWQIHEALKVIDAFTIIAVCIQISFPQDKHLLRSKYSKRSLDISK